MARGSVSSFAGRMESIMVNLSSLDGTKLLKLYDGMKTKQDLKNVFVVPKSTILCVNLISF